MTVPEISSHDAAVVRCASCGAARQDGAKACGYCGSDFTLLAQDMDTICPSCFALISNAAKFCHHCGMTIAPEDMAADPTDRLCPACGEGKFLVSRALNKTGLTVMECRGCAGLWLGAEVFRTIEERLRKEAPATPDPVALRADARSRKIAPQKDGRFYRRCPACTTPMTRINFDRVSGILLDRCHDHGIWFDATELESVLRWIKLGGERVSAERNEQEDRARASQRRFRVEPKAPEDTRWGTFPNRDQDTSFDAIPSIIRWLIKS
jgi:Zn-finger nucleic acid-binding protein/ribosomal protein L40E